MDVDRCLQYLDFVRERHHVWALRQAGEPGPWTQDETLLTRKFTNVYRVLDPGSQFVFELADDDPDPHDMMMRALLYRFTNRPEFWRVTRDLMGRWPVVADLDNDYLRNRWREARDVLGEQMFSGAYVVMPDPGGKKTMGLDKLAATVELGRRVLHPSGVDYLWPELEKATSLEQRFTVLTRPYAMGTFMTMQILTDWGYVFGPDQENDFVASGPGSRRGAAHLGMPFDLAMMWAHNEAQHNPTMPRLYTPSGGQRPPSYMDVQNTLCEFDKYVRCESRTQPGKPYVPVHPGPQPRPTLPTHW